MNIETFINQVGSEPEKVVTRTVWTAPPDVLAQAAKPGGLVITDLLSAAGRSAERREVHYRHILGLPASRETIHAWQRRHPHHTLPADLQQLMLSMNGIHLWADTDSGRAYVGLAPIEEWDLARTVMYGASADPGLLDDRYVAITYHMDRSAFVVLDVQSGLYFLMDTAGPDATTPVAGNVGELLDWLWQTRITPKE